MKVFVSIFVVQDLSLLQFLQTYAEDDVKNTWHVNQIPSAGIENRVTCGRGYSISTRSGPDSASS